MIPRLAMCPLWSISTSDQLGISGGSQMPLLSIPNSAQIPVVARVLAGRGRRIYKKGSYVIYKVLRKAAKYNRMGPLLGSLYFKNPF
jgi:hypothetical protein